MAKHAEDLAAMIGSLAAPELHALRRFIDRRLDSLQRAGGGSLMERLSSAQSVEWTALAVKRTGIRCRTLDTGERVTLRPYPGVRHESEAKILTVEPRRARAYADSKY